MNTLTNAQDRAAAIAEGQQRNAERQARDAAFQAALNAMSVPSRERTPDEKLQIEIDMIERDLARAAELSEADRQWWMQRESNGQASFLDLVPTGAGAAYDDSRKPCRTGKGGAA